MFQTMRFGHLSKRISRTTAAAAIGFTCLLSSQDASAMKIQNVTSPGGIKAWLVEEHGLPLLAMRFGFSGGSSQDPKGKPGVANLLTAMLDEGAGDMRAAAFQEREEELAMRLGFDAGRDVFDGTFQTLTENREEATDLLRLALTKPRFDADAIERMRQQISTGLVFDAKDPNKVAIREWYNTAFAGHPYARPVEGTIESVSKISPKDLEAFRKRNFAKDNLYIAVVGDITAAELGPMLDKVFGDLPDKAPLIAVRKTLLAKGPSRKVIEMDVPQSVAHFGHGALARDDDDFVPSYVLNYIIGGGGFNSRLMEEVREKRGLAYSVYSYIQPLRNAAIYLGGVATKNEEIDRSLNVIQDVLRRMLDEGPSQVELDNAKKYLTGSYALRFDSSAKIASQLLWIQIEGLGQDYVVKRNEMIDAVTLDDIKRVAKRLLKPENLIVTIVGRPSKDG